MEELNKLKDKVDKLEKYIKTQSTDTKSGDQIKHTKEDKLDEKDTTTVEKSES